MDKAWAWHILNRTCIQRMITGRQILKGRDVEGKRIGMLDNLIGQIMLDNVLNVR